MNADPTSAGAPSDAPMTWHGIDWASCHRTVRRLQARIVKATQEQRWSKVNALQWVLTHSLSGKALAVKRDTENHGKKTPGVDGATWSTPDAKMKAIRSLRRRGYHPKPLRRVYLPKPNGAKRALGIPCMHDRAMQALYLLALDPVAETIADPNSYGFRKGRSTHDAIEQCFTVLGKRAAPKWILEGDIKGCYDHISHDWMLQHIPMDKTILAKWLKAGVIEQGQWCPTDQGVPQGGIISPAVANLVLNGLEQRLAELIPRRKSIGNVRTCSMVHLIRYADDFIATGRSPEVLMRVKAIIAAFLSERGLTLAEAKTRIVHIEAGFDFLGQNVRKYKGTLLIKPSKGAMKQALAKIRTLIRRHRTATQSGLIQVLNPIIRGWTNYHRHSVASKAFGRFDYAIWQSLWHWARRRHPKKGARWIRKRYFQTSKGRTWTFACNTGTTEQPKLVKVVYATDTKITRHRKVKAEANPYDPQWEPYFEERWKHQMGTRLLENRKAWHCWLTQEGRCPECGEHITEETGWQLHHVVYRVHGGTDAVTNLQLMHPNCHRKLHHRAPREPGSWEHEPQKGLS